MKEDELRTRIFAALKLLESENKIRNVTDNCGTHEHGIDLYFDKEDIFGLHRKYGIQLKENIDAREIKNALGQLSIAFGHRFSFSPNDGFVDYVYVIACGDITSPAKEYFKEANVGFRNIFLIERGTIDLFLNNIEIRMRTIAKEA